jgi:hypothetical protein
VNTGWIDGRGRTVQRLRELGRIKIGTVVELAGREPILIGELNEMGGSCDDCCEMSGTDIVVRYRQVNWKYQAVSLTVVREPAEVAR